MATLIMMPRLSPTMEEGVLAKWTKKEGERIAPGDVIAEVETDKATMDFPLEDEGTLLKVLVPEGATVKLGAPVAVLGETGEDIAALLAEAASAAQGAPSGAASAGNTAPQAAAEPPRAPASSPPAPGSPPLGQSGRTLASPLARRLAADAGLDIRQIPGTGPGGRVVKRDIERARASQPPAATPETVSRVPPLPKVPDPTAGELVPLSMMRKTIARRMVEAKQAVPHIYLTSEARVDTLWRFREELNRAAGPDNKVSFNDLVIKAMARALRVVPAANVLWSDQGIVRPGRVDLGVAVALEEGLITPVVRGAADKSLGAIAAEVRSLVERARQKRLRPEEYQGATFSVTNLGMYGIREFFAIINPPEPGILSVGKIEKRPAVVERDGEDVVVIERRMTLGLSCDHRTVDGALGARLLAEVVRALEQPLLLVL